MNTGLVAIVHERIADDAPEDARDLATQVRCIADALASLGRQCCTVATDLDLETLGRTLRDTQPALVFNLVETLDGSGELAWLAPALFEHLGLPFTGSDGVVLQRTGCKPDASACMRDAGLPVPAQCGDPQALRALPGAWIIKPASEDASVGIGDDAVCPDGIAAATRLEERLAEGGRWFAESFIEGREFCVGLLQDAGAVQVLPVAELCFVDYPAGKPHILGYAAKWDSGSFEYRNTVRRFGIETADPSLARRLASLARRCWNLFGLRGYARVDFRVDADGAAWLLEVNANPCLSPDAGFAAMAAAAGIHLSEVTARICAALDFIPARAPGSGAGGQLPGDAQWRTEPQPADRAAVARLVRAAGNFSAEELAIAVELVDEALQHGTASGYDFLFLEAEGRLQGYACYGAIPGSHTGFDLYWIVVDPDAQGHGLGRVILQEVERRVAARGGIRLYIDTSGGPAYLATREFYLACGYRLEACLRDFYAPGDDKCIFSRDLAGRAMPSQ